MDVQDIGEAVVVNTIGLSVALNSAQWGQYFGEPSNIVAFVVAVSLVAYNSVRIWSAIRRNRND